MGHLGHHEQEDQVISDGTSRAAADAVVLRGPLFDICTVRIVLTLLFLRLEETSTPVAKKVVPIWDGCDRKFLHSFRPNRE